MTALNPAKYDRTTHWLHAALAVGVVVQLLLSAFMTVPAGRGQGVHDWRRSAFELHAKVGLFVAAVCVCHWIWIFSPWARPGYTHLFPWLKHEGRTGLHRALPALSAWSHRPLSAFKPLVGTVHGLGFLAVTGSSICGFINYLGYFLGEAIPGWLLHDVGKAHIAFGVLLWLFVCAHITMAVAHRITARHVSASNVSS